MTLLHVAATEGRVNIVECLIKKGADTNVKNLVGVRLYMCILVAINIKNNLS